MATPTTNQLRSTITEMDSASQDAFSEIATIAKLALASLETPDAYTNPECMAIVLNAIFDRAMDVENNINAMAEEVGCNYKDQAQRRRMDARSKARETTSSGVTA
ncbi:MAG: hypothetical protein HHJ17_08660 [Rhodoferax sp.]|uniref:hypothetical protein n=1 Tax=Rhodoferax sp. TaxID=50421 RepID=UPI0017B1E83C|nr:hypothetical protein [Rhodoferax sp.]NMM13592.1 hypothetical protein [Rhodoferax sp.]